MNGLALLDPETLCSRATTPFLVGPRSRFPCHLLASFDHRRRPETLRTAMAIAFFCPTKTTSSLPRAPAQPTAGDHLLESQDLPAAGISINLPSRSLSLAGTYWPVSDDLEARMQITGMLYGARLLEHVEFPASEVLGPGATEDEIQGLIDRHKLIFIKPLFRGGIGKKGKVGLDRQGDRSQDGAEGEGAAVFRRAPARKCSWQSPTA